MNGWDPYGGYPDDEGGADRAFYPDEGMVESEDAYESEDNGGLGTQDEYPQIEAYPPDEAYAADAQRESAYDRYAAQYDQPHEQPAPPRRARQSAPVISQNPTLNLICTLCAGMGLFALFLCFAERRSRVIRRCAVQSAGLLCVTVFLSAALGILGLLTGWIPLLGALLGVIFWILWAVLAAWALVQRVKLMLHAYRGEAYMVPLIDRHCRQFE